MRRPNSKTWTASPHVRAPLAVGIALFSCTGTGGPTANVITHEPLEVSRAPLEQRLLLTGEVEAAKSVAIPVPRTDEWNISIRWLAKDGEPVNEGDLVVEFDNTAVAERIRELELAVIEANIELDTHAAENEIELEDEKFEVQAQETAVAKAELDATVPRNLVSKREAWEFELELTKAQTALSAAREELRSAQKAGQLELEVKRIAYEKTLRALESAEAQLEALSLRAPRDGTVLIEDHPWEGRKLQVGDNVWPGFTIVALPDLSNMRIEATLSDVDDGRIHPGMKATCTIDAHPSKPLPSTIVGVSPVARDDGNRSTRRFFSVAIELDEPHPELLRPGLSVKIEVITRRNDDAIVAPRRGLDLSGQPPVALMAGGEHRPVDVEFCDAHRCSITNGLTEGDELRTYGEESR